MRFKVERLHGAVLGLGTYPPSDMSGWAREFIIYLGMWAVILKVWR